MFYSPMALQQARHQSETDADASKGQTAIDAEDVHVTYDDGTEAVRGLSLSMSKKASS
jgi:ABC-2 type transport system ATP-binding protein